MQRRVANNDFKAHSAGCNTSSRVPQAPTSVHQVQPRIDPGYVELCDFVTSADDVLVVRRFHSAHARAILQLQDNITHKEEQLGDLDDETRAAVVSSRDLESLRNDPTRERQQLIRDIRALLEEYGKCSTEPRILCHRAALNTEGIERHLSQDICSHEPSF